MDPIKFIFDFGSPNAYLSHKVVPKIAERTGATFKYIPCLLGGIFKATNNQPPMLAYANIPSKMAYERLEMQRFIQQHGLDKFTMNPHFPVNTVMLMRGAVVMDMEGQLPAYIEAMLKCMWETGKKMDDPEVYHAEVASAGFDADHIVQRIQTDEVKLRENTQHAIDHGVFGIPTFFVGDEMFFGKDRLRDVEDMIAAS